MRRSRGIDCSLKCELLSRMAYDRYNIDPIHHFAEEGTRGRHAEHSNEQLEHEVSVAEVVNVNEHWHWAPLRWIPSRQFVAAIAAASVSLRRVRHVCYLKQVMRLQRKLHNLRPTNK